MGKLNGPWAIGWVGDTSGCEEYNVVDLKSKVGLLFQTSQSELNLLFSRQVVQIVHLHQLKNLNVVH